MFDFWPRPPERSYAELILKKMRPAIFILTFSPSNFLLCCRTEKSIRSWRRRASGGSFSTSATALRVSGFEMPCLRSSRGSYPIRCPPISYRNYNVFRMTEVMSKFLAMGVPFSDIIQRSTINPAREIRRPELGTLSVGKEADIAVLEQLKGSFSYIDCGVARMDGKVKLIARMTVRAGRIVYDPSGLSMVEWEKARPQYSPFRR